MAELHRCRNLLLHGDHYLGEVSALSFLHIRSCLSPLPYLLAGSGSQILLYDLNSAKLIRSFQVFDGVRVHGIVIDSCEEILSNNYNYRLVLFGEKRVKLFSLTVELDLNSEENPEALVDLNLVYSFPSFSHWVLDVCFLKEENECLAIGCSDNSIRVWDINESRLILEVPSPERCLLYSMRLWGNSFQALRMASGTIYNEIIIWKVILLNGDKFDCRHYGAVHMHRLIGHEGSIFRIVWSSDGSKLVSVSDDRSARIWEVDSVRNDSAMSEGVVGTVLFGHSARVWDCCVSGSLIVTAGEDCTCRVWSLDGRQLELIKEHIGRGVWRCLYDPDSSLLVTAGFDSAIKVHQSHNSLSRSFMDCVETKKSANKTEVFSISLLNSPQHVGLMDSKSEYVRCLRFTAEDSMYIATNHGYLYHANLITSENVKWTKVLHITEEGPIICMDVLLGRAAKNSRGLDDWVALGDGKGNMTVVRVIGDICDPEVGFSRTWSAGLERQLLETYWCRSLGYRYVFTANPRGMLKLWRLSDPLASVSSDPPKNCDVSLLAEFPSSFGARIICLDASFEDEVLVCGDLRGNLLLFPLLKDMLEGPSASSELKISPINHFKGVHGISSVSSLSVATLTSSKVEIRSTGGDGCICFLEYDTHEQTLEFMGLKQAKELSLIQSIWTDIGSDENRSTHQYAVGFASTDFILWNITSETKVVQISCGGWRRPHSFYFGDIPEMKNCFAYVKDEVIHIHKHWVREKEIKMFPQTLHTQFHGREIHSLCFVSRNSKVGSKVEEQRFSDTSSWIATGCEDGTVRLTRYASEVKNWSTSELLGEHVGGSAVRSVCCVSTTHVVAPDKSEQEDIEIPCLLISVGAKRVLTSWLLRNGKSNKKEETMTFQWLSTDMPAKVSRACAKTEKYEQLSHPVAKDSNGNISLPGSDFHQNTEKYEDDWRYMAVTAFLLKCVGSRLTICFVVVGSSDATLTLRALLLPHRLWFDVAFLVPLSSPVLTLQHVIVPLNPPPKANTETSNVYLVISGATDGSIAFWDITKSIKSFVKQVSALNFEMLIDCQKRPRTGRGSQGGRKWKSLTSNIPKKRQDKDSAGEAAENGRRVCSEVVKGVSHKTDVNTSIGLLLETCEIEPIHVLKKAHQSGVNCLHVSLSKHCQSSNFGSLFDAVSGGDDQALHRLRFDVISSAINSENANLPIQSYRIRLLEQGRKTSAHSSAIKGVWTDGTWVFSTGLDQRVRCWSLEENGKLIERALLIISVPEPETLAARPSGEDRYQIAVAGRGMQMVEFSGGPL